MDVDRFLATHDAVWTRLDELVDRASRHGRLAPVEVDELVRLYQRTSTHLSTARTTYADPALTAALTNRVGRARAVIYGSQPRSWRAVSRFVTDTFPAALWHTRWFSLASTLLFMVPAAVIAIWLGSSEAALEAAGPEALREAYVAEDFEEYYSADPSAQFAAQVTTNNIQVGFFAFAGGIFGCVLTAVILVFNGANVGFAAGLFAAAGELPRFFGLILPHGLLELTAVFVAGAAGLRLGWALIDPGDRRRADALVEEGRRAVVLVIGLVGVFAIAGLVEGFVTGAPWPTWSRVGIGVVVWLTFLAYAWILGRDAAARGLTGAIGEDDPAGWADTPHAPLPAAP